MAPSIASPVVTETGTTRLQASLERAAGRNGPSVGQWLEFPGYSLARTVAPLGADVRNLVSARELSSLKALTDKVVGVDRLRTWGYRRQGNVSPGGGSVLFRGIPDCPHPRLRALDDEEGA